MDKDGRVLLESVDERNVINLSTKTRYIFCISFVASLFVLTCFIFVVICTLLPNVC